eukprot:3420606-Rhodomonas_salina.4
MTRDLRVRVFEKLRNGDHARGPTSSSHLAQLFSLAPAGIEWPNQDQRGRSQRSDAVGHSDADREAARPQPPSQAPAAERGLREGEDAEGASEH